MNAARLPLREQLVVLEEMLRRNPVLVEIMDRAMEFDLPNWYMTSGSIFQTVWNVLTDRPATWGIRDYDLFYFNDLDISWEAEDVAIQRGREVFGELAGLVEIRNEARVHLWYEQKFGNSCPPYDSTEAAIDSFVATTCSIGVRQLPDRTWSIYAPHGLSDIFNMVIRPNPVLASADVYLRKSARWLDQWPELTVMDWPLPAPASSASG